MILHHLFHIFIAFINIASKKTNEYFIYLAIWNVNRLDVYSRSLDIVKNVILSLSFIVSEFRLKFTGGGGGRERDPPL